MPAFVAGARSQSDALLLLDPGIGQGLGEAGDREVPRRGAIDDRRNDPGRQEGDGSQQADVPFALGLTLGNLGEGANAAEPDVVDPSPGLGDGGEQSVPAFRPHRPFGAGRIYRDQLRAALWTRRGWRMERRCDASIGQPRKALYQLFIRIKKIVTGGVKI